jgi:spoIIIJ-associated protein
MILQEDNDIRSRSVGDGLFKKILIYKPGKGNKPTGRKRPQAKGRQNKSGSKKGGDS